MAVSCEAHPFEQATGECRTCGEPFCSDCLVYSHGEKQPPFCIPCALTAAGVRSTAARRRERAGIGSAGRIAVGMAVFAGVGAAAVPVAMAYI